MFLLDKCGGIFLWEDKDVDEWFKNLLLWVCGICLIWWNSFVFLLLFFFGFMGMFLLVLFGEVMVICSDGLEKVFFGLDGLLDFESWWDFVIIVLFILVVLLVFCFDVIFFWCLYRWIVVDLVFVLFFVILVVVDIEFYLFILGGIIIIDFFFCLLGFLFLGLMIGFFNIILKCLVFLFFVLLKILVMVVFFVFFFISDCCIVILLFIFRFEVIVLEF